MTLYTVSWETFRRLDARARGSIGTMLAARIRFLRETYPHLIEWAAVHPSVWGPVSIVAKTIEP